MGVPGVLCVCLFLLWYHLGEMGAGGAVTRDLSASQIPNVMRRYHYFVLPMKKWEGESLQRESRQQSNSPGSGGSLAPAGTASNVINILTGLFQEDVRPIVSGSTAFIPIGGLREGVTELLQGLAPALQRILFGNNSSLPVTDYTIATAAPVIPTDPPTSSPPRRVGTTTLATPSTSILPEENSEEETETPGSTTEVSPATSSVAATTAAQPTPSSVESEEETEAPATTSNSLLTPVTEKVAGVVPESAPVEPVAIQAFVPRDTPNTTGLATTSFATQLKVVLEEPSTIVTANVVSNMDGEEKQYVYLVLLPEQYKQLEQLTAAAAAPPKTTTSSIIKGSMSQSQPPSAEEEIVEAAPSTTSNYPTPTATTNRTSLRYRTRNRHGTTISPPPHLQLQFYYRLTPSTTPSTTTTTVRIASTDLPGVKGFEGDDDEQEN